MTHDQWISLFAPAVAGLVTALVALLGALVTGLVGKLSAYLTSHKEAALASAVASADTVVQRALQTGASTIAGKISNGSLDYTDKAALTAEAQREVGLVEARVPDMIAVAKPVGEALVASMLGKVDAAVVASPTIPSTPVVAPVIVKAA